jgi:hypothetical protein
MFCIDPGPHTKKNLAHKKWQSWQSCHLMPVYGKIANFSIFAIFA